MLIETCRAVELLQTANILVEFESLNYRCRILISHCRLQVYLGAAEVESLKMEEKW